MRAAWRAGGFFFFFASVACRGAERDARDLPAPALHEPSTFDPEPLPDWALQVGSEPASSRGRAPHQADLSASARARNNAESAARALPATMPDRAFAEDTPGDVLPVRRLVYRTTFVVPPALRTRNPPLLGPAGELHIDVSSERLRARFFGPGWPVDERTEVRLRADIPGVYLFDGQGGRPLAPGRLAAWFQGDEDGEVRAAVRVRREYGKRQDDGGPGALMCALLAEWTDQPREDLASRCAGGSLAPAFRFGLWAAELTAIVPLQLTRSDLRADSGSPPEAITAWSHRAMLEPIELEHLAPLRLRPDNVWAKAPLPEVGEEGAALHVDNQRDTRVIVIVQGVPVGWVAPFTSATFSGFTPGYYRVGAVRPFGQPVMTPTLQRIPGELRLGKKGELRLPPP